MKISGQLRRPRLSVLAVAVQALIGFPVWALPQGAVVVNGQVGISQPAAGTLQVTAGHGAIINWQGFSIGPGELARFIQPSAQSAVLNRVTGAEMSQLLGQLQANGQVFLINPNGIVVGSGARIDTNSFVASTLDLADADFLAGRMRFMAGSTAAGIRNDGLITAGPGAMVALIAPNIVNNGIIHTPGGQILLAAGRSIEIASTDQAGVRFEIQAPTDSVINLGKLLAENGAVSAFAATLRNSGEIRADRMVQGADGSISLVASGDLSLTAESIVSASGVSGNMAGGQVLLESAGGTTRVAGAIAATGSGAAGGGVQVLGQRVALEAGALIDASGGSGGGQVLVGGDFQGANAQVQNAQRVNVAEGAVLRADAIDQGDGGRIIVWADENTRFAGALSARGGAQGGAGGFAEVSGKVALQFTGSADLRAPRGALGTLLFDPLDIVVASGSGILPSVVDEFADFEGNVITIDPAKLDAIGANVLLQANRDVFVKDRITLGTPGASVTIAAGGADSTGGGIYLEDLGEVRPGGIFTSGGAVNLSGSGVSGPGTISTGGGAVDIRTTGDLAYSGPIRSGGGAVTLEAGGSVIGADVAAGTGDISVSAEAGISGGRYESSARIALHAADGDVSVNDIAGGSVDLRAAGSIDATVQASERIDAESSGSSVSLTNRNGASLRLGTVRAATGIYLYATAGLEQVSGGGLHTDNLNVWTYGSGISAGSVSAPLWIESLTPTEVTFRDLAAPVHLRFGADTVVKGLSLAGTVGALGWSSVLGSVNLSDWSFGSAVGSLQFSGQASSFSGQLALRVSDGGLQVGNLNLQGGGSAYLEARGPVMLGTVVTTRASGYGLDVQATQQCNSGAICESSSPISIGSVDAGTGSVWLRNWDNGDIRASGSITAGSLVVQAGQVYSVYTGIAPDYYLGYPTTNHVDLNAVTTRGNVSVLLRGHGDLDIGSISADGSVDLRTGVAGTVSLNGVAAGSSVNVQAGGNLVFDRIASTSSSVTLSSSSGAVRTLDDAQADIVAATSVTVTASDSANGFIGDSGFANPMDIQASGATSVISLSAGHDIGAIGHEVRVDTAGTVRLASQAGRFHVAAVDFSDNSLRDVANVELTASAAGVGNGQTARFRAGNIDVAATSDGTNLTLADVIQQANTSLDAFRFTATGSGLNAGAISLTEAGRRQLSLTAGDITTGNVTARSIELSGANLDVGSMTATGTLPSDGLVLTASGTIHTRGSISSARSARLTAAGGDIRVGLDGTGAVSAGANTSDTLRLQAQGQLTTGRLSTGGTLEIDVGGAYAPSANLSAARALITAGGDITIDSADAGEVVLTTRAGSDGNIDADLTGTTRLTVNADGGFLVDAAGELSQLTVNAKWDGATGGLSNGASITAGDIGLSSQKFELINQDIVIESGGLIGNWSVNYNDASTTTVAGGLGLAISHGAGGSVNVNLESDTQVRVETTPGLTATAASLLLNAGGTIHLSDVATRGGAVTATSRSGDIAILSVSTDGLGVAGEVTLTSETGDIYLSDGNGISAAIESFVGTVLTLSPGADVTLNARQGSIGAGPAGALPLANVRNLTLRARDTVNVDANLNGNIHALTSLDIETSVGGSGALTVNSLNFGALNLGRDTANGNLTLGGLTGTGAFGLAATDGGIAVTGNIGGGVTNLTLDAQGGDLSLVAAGGALSVAATGTMDLRASNDILIGGGSQAGESVAVTAGGLQMTTGGDVTLAGGAGSDAYARIVATGTQSGSIGGDFVVRGGNGVNQGTGAYASFSGGSQSLANIGGAVLVKGGTAQGNHAQISSTGTQRLGLASTSYFGGTDSIRVEGGSGTSAYASITAGGNQTLSAGGVIQAIGGSAAGALAEIAATGANASQTIGGNSTSSNDATDLIEVRGGSAALARIVAGGHQTLRSAGDIVVAGGSGTGASASIVSLNSSQVIGSSLENSMFDATDAIRIEGGTGTGAFAAIRAFNGQVLEAGGDIALSGGGSGAYAEVVTTSGAQQVGNASNDATDRITLTGGAGASARIATGGNQVLQAQTAIALTGGSGPLSMAQISAQSGQTVISSGTLAITGGTDSGTGANGTGIVNTTSGNQQVTAGGTIAIVGGGGATDTGILQQAVGAAQSVTAGGAIDLSAPMASSGAVLIDSAGSQDVRADGAMSLVNAGGRDLRLNAAGGDQNVQATSLRIGLEGTQADSFAGITTENGHDQTVRVIGDGVTAGSATVSLRNTSSGSGARVAIASSGALDLRATDDNYDTAGRIQVGDAADLGASEISAATDLNLVAGSLLIQGGATATATAAVNATDYMRVSTVYGSMQLLGGAAGSASIDPALLDVASTGSVLLQGGSGATAWSLITAGTFNLASTGGDLSMVSGGAIASIDATNFKFFGPGAANLQGGTISVSESGLISILGQCFSCDSAHLLGSFTVNAFVPFVPGGSTTPTPVPIPLGGYVEWVTGETLSLSAHFGDAYELVYLEDGTAVMRLRRSNQCSV